MSTSSASMADFILYQFIWMVVICFSSSYGQVSPINICSSTNTNVSSNTVQISTPNYPSTDDNKNVVCRCLVSWIPAQDTRVQVSRTVWSFDGYFTSCWGYLTLQYSATQNQQNCLSATPNNPLVDQPSVQNVLLEYKRDKTYSSKNGKFLLNVQVFQTNINLNVNCGSTLVFPPRVIFPTSTTTSTPDIPTDGSQHPVELSTVSSMYDPESSSPDSNHSIVIPFETKASMREKSESEVIVGIVVGIACFVAVTTGLILAVCYIKHRRQQKPNPYMIPHPRQSDFLETGATANLPENDYQLETIVEHVYSEPNRGMQMERVEMEPLDGAYAVVRCPGDQGKSKEGVFTSQESVYADMDKSTKKKKYSNSDEPGSPRKLNNKMKNGNLSPLMSPSPIKPSDKQEKNYYNSMVVVKNQTSLDDLVDPDYAMEKVENPMENSYESYYASVRPAGDDLHPGSSTPGTATAAAAAAASEYYAPSPVYDAPGSAENGAEEHYYSNTNCLKMLNPSDPLDHTTGNDARIYENNRTVADNDTTVV